MEKPLEVFGDIAVQVAGPDRQFPPNHPSVMDNPKLIIFLVVLGWAVLQIAWHRLRARLLVKRWAKENGFELLKMQQDWFGDNPFDSVSKRQDVYRIRVRDRWGRERRGWVKCGSYWLGYFSDDIEVKWH